MNSVADGFAAYMAAMRAGLMPDKPLWVDEWADEHMRIPRGLSAHPGRYNSALTPYAREVMHCLSPGHPARRVAMMAASQITKTQVGLNWMCASIKEAPANFLVLMPTDGLAKRLSSRIAKTVQAMPVLSQVVAAPRSRDARNTIDTKEFDGGVMYIVTARSAANLAEIPARYVYADEIDRWPADVDKEGDPLKLAENRTSSFGRKAKLYFSSTPSVEGDSAIHEMFLRGDQCEYFVPCPHCGHLHTLELDNLRHDNLAHAWHVCPQCAGEIEERHKTELFAAGEWHAAASGDGETVSFHLSAAYAPLGAYSWLDMAREYEEAKRQQQRGLHEAMQVFYNTRLARVWSIEHDQTDANVLKRRAEDYPLRYCPQSVLIVTCAIDVQHDRLEVLTIGWGRDEEVWPLDRFSLTGDPAQNEVWQKADDYLLSTIQHASGQRLKIEACAVDTGGHHTHEVYNFCRLRQARRVFAIKGQDKPGGPIKGRSAPQDVNDRGRVLKRGVKLWFVGTTTAKDLLHNRLQLEKAGPGYIHFSTSLSDEFYAELTAEKRIKKRTARGDRWVWFKPHGVRNETTDLFVYNIWCAHMLDLHKYTDAHWSRRESVVAPIMQDLLAASPAPAPVAPAVPSSTLRFVPTPASVRPAHG
jgi:phage terminase large subunit GpA-like protein